MRTLCIVLGACLTILGCGSPLTASTIAVPAGGDLQAALASAQPGDTILLARGATYTGPFTLTDKGSSSSFITIRTAGDEGLPGFNERIGPAAAPLLARIQPSADGPAIRTAPGAHHWRLMLVEIPGNATAGDLVALGDGSEGQSSLSQVPHDLVLDRVYLHGDATRGQKRGIALNSASTDILNSYISDIKADGQDSQAICGWNGPGPYTITNNYVEAGAENLLFGGSDPAITDLVPSDITISGNLFSRPPAWRTERWVVKNLFELKNARRVTVTGNTFEYNWAGGQSGFAILFTVRNQNGQCTWCQVDHVTFEYNVVRHSGAGMQILGRDSEHPSQQTQSIVIRHNVFSDIDSEHWGGNGYFLLLTGGPRDVTIDHNTIIQDHAAGIVQLDGPPIPGFTYTNNVARHNSYGFIGSDHGIGNDSINTFLPGATITNNVFAGGSSGAYPAANLFPTTAQFEAQFQSYVDGDYRLLGSSAWKGAGPDGQDLGALVGSPGVPPVPAPPASFRTRGN